MTNFVEHRVQAAGFSSTTVRDEKFNCEIAISIRREYALWSKQVGQRIMVASVADRSRSVSTGVAGVVGHLSPMAFLFLATSRPRRIICHTCRSYFASTLRDSQRKPARNNTGAEQCRQPVTSTPSSPQWRLACTELGIHF